MLVSFRKQLAARLSYRRLFRKETSIRDGVKMLNKASFAWFQATPFLLALFARCRTDDRNDRPFVGEIRASRKSLALSFVTFLAAVLIMYNRAFWYFIFSISSTRYYDTLVNQICGTRKYLLGKFPTRDSILRVKVCKKLEFLLAICK